MITLDDFDRRILRELQRDSRQTVADLAAKIGLSTTPCWRRIKRLEEAGVILPARAIVDPKAVGLDETIYVWVALERQAKDARQAFKRRIADIPQVVEAYYTAGNWDFVLKVVVPNTAAYDELLRTTLYGIDGVEKVMSHIVLEPVKYPPEIPV